ncbi:MAG TPA: CoA transferase subunit A [Bacillota bacterium]|nr:CoA transferase subunit A [Bacillota bacterium]HOH09826.1 CoA transferase subunit A [Bacillota bacterium]HOY89190.1 CoA transferase subunit A [Bacillota bacterium]HPI00761.1 CoA transferase subunit A [Bacillota bacterium]HPM64206.1 CoA transferase subunit A [Bacillota bacterium]
MAKLLSLEQAARMIPDGASVMVGGFMGCGSPHRLIDAIVTKGVRGLTVYCNDAGWPGHGVARLITAGLVKTLNATHVGLNPEVAALMASGGLEVRLIPQGTMAEQIRAGGNGTGGVLTPTGIGTMAAEGRQVVDVDGKRFLLEKPIRADFAIISGYQVDHTGNIWYKGSTRNFNPLMATAADTVIVEADTLVEDGCIEPENVVTPGIFIDYIVKGGAW